MPQTEVRANRRLDLVHLRILPQALWISKVFCCPAGSPTDSRARRGIDSCSCSTSSAAVLAFNSQFCSDWVIGGGHLCSH